MLRPLCERLKWIEARCEVPPKAETLRILQGLDQLRDMPPKLTGQPARALLPDGVDQLRGPTAEIYRLVLADKAPGRALFAWISLPKVPIGLRTSKLERTSQVV
jgi:hypothetical protein